MTGGPGQTFLDNWTGALAGTLLALLLTVVKALTRRAVPRTARSKAAPAVSLRPDSDSIAGLLAVAVVLAVGLVGSAILANVIIGHSSTSPLGDESALILGGAVGGLIGVLGCYLGRRAVRRDKDDP